MLFFSDIQMSCVLFVKIQEGIFQSGKSREF